jgi:magnesium-protoporphyrin IX monomethyl ester (oxidative) cyclase
MYLNDTQRADFYASIGLEARQYDKEVIAKTNETAGRVFPIILDVDHPEFYGRLETCVSNNEKLRAIDASNQAGWLKNLQKFPIFLSNGWQFLKLFLIKPIPSAALARSFGF